MDSIERNARLLKKVLGGHTGEPFARWLHEAGLTLLPLEPDDATVDEMAREIEAFLFRKAYGHDDGLDAHVRDTWQSHCEEARAAYRAAVRQG